MSKVLLVDDNADFLQMMSIYLRSEGYDVHSANSGESAIALLDEQPNHYDIVITDIIMPGQDGFDVIDYVSAHTSAKIIALSGGGVMMSSARAVEAIQEKTHASLQKPVDLIALNDTVKEILAIA